ncbi:hypothetical protein MBLNU230_g4635t1 [Neophaeotheca triangularis]
MRLTQYAGVCLAALTSFSLATAVPVRSLDLEERQDRKADSACKNGPYTRMCWENGFSVATDFDQKFPLTGNTVTYDLEIKNTTCNPDGMEERTCLMINDQYPGPTIRATWGDDVVVNVKNSMQDNGTSIHWHGVRQYHTTGDDGVGGITECAIAPGDTKTYRFTATQFGSSWYHSHFSSQYGDGVVGTMIFDGPATAPYDEDLGPYVVNDWYYTTAFQMDVLALNNLQAQSPPPGGDNILINGTNKNPDGGGEHNKVKGLKKNKKYRLRIVNTSVDNAIRVSLDGHKMTVIATDYIPSKPFEAETILIAVGQRYDVVIKMDQEPGNYWFRANNAADCRSSNKFYGRAIWTYNGVKEAEPTSDAHDESGAQCIEPTGVAPYWVQPVPSSTFTEQLKSMDISLTRAQVVPNGDSVFVWALNQTSMSVEWDKPTLTYVMDGEDEFPEKYNVIPTIKEGGWNYWLIQQVQGVPPIPHPIHLHGHDFYVLGHGSGSYSPDTELNFATPPRRDTAILPGGGWLALAFESNNPGAWLMHCHLAWHISEGLGVQFLEEPDQIEMPNAQEYEKTCTNWKEYEKNMFYPKDDSGL